MLVTLAALSLVWTTIAAAPSGSCSNTLSCSSDAKTADPCCVPKPGGLIILRQRFEPDVGGDMGSWGIDGVEVLDCETQQPVKVTPFSRAYSHEEIGSFCHKSKYFSSEAAFAKAESDWAQSEVGEGVEELWERSWSTAGRFISTLDPSCVQLKDAARGSEVPEFFHTVQNLHTKFDTGKLLADADITPSDDTTYSLKELVEALTFSDHKPVVHCINKTLSTISWPLHVRRTFQDGQFVPSTIWTASSNCPADGILYPPSTTIHPPAPTQSWDPITRPRPRPITMAHDDSRLYFPPAEESQPNRQDPLKLKFFKGRDQGRENKPDNVERMYGRDEL